MRKLLKKYAFVPERLVTDDLRSYSAAVRDLGIENAGTSAGGGRIIDPSVRTSRPAGGAQDAALQERRVRAEVSFNPRRRLQHIQRPAPPHLSPDASHALRCGDEHVARGSRCGLTIPEAPTLRARGMAM
jgi:hypothetical protein